MITGQDLFASVSTGVRLCYRLDGPVDGPVALLIGGLGEDLTAWSGAFVDRLVGRGYRVVRHDNRDLGRSSTIDRPPPSAWRQLAARPRPDSYSLADMAADSVGLLDQLGIARAHVVGRSMGGMIAQTLAARYPDRVATLTSLYSTTGAPDVGQATLKTKLMLVGSPPPRTREQAIAGHLKMLRHLAGPAFGLDERAEGEIAATMWNRAGGPSTAGIARQIQAIQASGDRTAELTTISAPTLIIHGDRDLIVDPTGGEATAAAIPGARHIVVPGMGHHLNDDLADLVVTEIDTTAASVSAGPVTVSGRSRGRRRPSASSERRADRKPAPSTSSRAAAAEPEH